MLCQLTKDIIFNIRLFQGRAIFDCCLRPIPRASDSFNMKIKHVIRGGIKKEANKLKT